MVVAGIDVAKDKLDGVVFKDGLPISRPWCIANTPPGITQKLTELKQVYRGIEIVCESTGNYHLELVAGCHRLNLPLRILNPIVTKQQTRSTVRKTKTDTVDAAIIARLGCQGEGTLCLPLQYQNARDCIRVAIRLTKQTTVLKQLLHSISLIPARQRSAQITQLLEGLLDKQLAVVAELYQTASAAIDPDILKLIQTVPGMGPKTAVTFLAEVDDINRFSNSKALVAYAGFDPVIRQSGHGPVRYGKLTKRGSAPLRRALFLAANAARRSDPELATVYAKKRAEGKGHTVATIHGARKLLYRIYAVLKQKRAYEIRPVGVKSKKPLTG